MHEFSICQNIVEAVLSELEKSRYADSRLLKITVAVGALRQIIPEYLESAYATLVTDTPAEGSCLEIRMIPIVLKCLACEQQGEFRRPPFICQQCGSGKMETVSGMELYLENLEIEEKHESNHQSLP